jgi:hypothetical protein
MDDRNIFIVHSQYKSRTIFWGGSKCGFVLPEAEYIGGYICVDMDMDAYF